MSEQLILVGARVVTDERVIERGYVTVADGQIQAVGSLEQLTPQPIGRVIDLPAAYMIIPGMIDVHIHGVAGSDVMDGTPEALQTMATALPREGTTAFLATTLTQASSQIEHALANAAQYIDDQPAAGQAECVGIHLEGPFISAERAGAQPLEYIVAPQIDTFVAWQEQAAQQIKLVTLAPEEGDGYELVAYLQQTGVIASIGHSNATYDEVRKAIAQGATHVTHLFNGMRGLHHREPGVAGAAMLSPELMVELIVDGIHCHPEMVAFAHRMLTTNRTVLITDAIRAKCLRSGTYDVGGQTVQVTAGSVRLADGRLAGSILKMDTALRNVMRYTGCSLVEAVRMTSTNAAGELGLDKRKGSIAVGKDADLVILNSAYEISHTYCRGTLAFERR